MCLKFMAMIYEFTLNIINMNYILLIAIVPFWLFLGIKIFIELIPLICTLPSEDKMFFAIPGMVFAIIYITGWITIYYFLVHNIFQ